MTALNVAVVTETHPPEVNGVAMTVGQLIDGLRGRGHRVNVVRPRQSSDDRGSEGDLLLAGLPLPGYAGLRVGLPAGGFLEDQDDDVRIAAWAAALDAAESAVRVKLRALGVDA